MSERRRENMGPSLSCRLRHFVRCGLVRGHGGWSVLVTGRLREITDPDELATARRLPLAPWWHRVDQRFVRLSIDLLSGRRL